MREHIIVEIGPCEQFTTAIVVRIEKWAIRANNTIYFDKSVVVKGLGDQEHIVPEDTLIVLEGHPQNSPVVNKAVRVVSPTWSLNFGIHAGTITSRDSERIDGFESLEAVREWFRRSKANWPSFYQCWFAHAIPPKGSGQKLVQLESGTPYLR